MALAFNARRSLCSVFLNEPFELTHRGSQDRKPEPNRVTRSSVSHDSDPAKELWKDARAAYVRMTATSRESKKISARMRLTDQANYLALCRKFTELQIEWNQAYRIFVDTHSRLTALMRVMKYPADDFSSLCRALVADVDDGTQPSEVSLSFHRAMGLPLQVGPAPWFRITGNRIHQGPHDQTVGILEKCTWQANGEHFTSYDFQGSAEVQLDDRPLSECEVFGPFDFLHMANTVLWTDAKPLLKFSRKTQHWQHVQTNIHWPEMIIKPA
jgi:hypothetical protein